MTSSSQADLILLIRLLHDDLSAQEGAFVRRKLAGSRQFTERYHALNAATRAPWAPEESLSGIDTTNIDRVAQFVDETLSPQQRIEFESACWQLPALLREVIATWRATRKPNQALRPPAGFAGRMIRSVRSTAAADTEPDIHSDAAAAVSRRQSRQASRNLSAGRVEHNQAQPGKPAVRTAAALLPGAVATVVISLFAASWFAQDFNTDRLARDDRPQRRNRARDTAPVHHSPVQHRNDSVRDEPSVPVDSAEDSPVVLVPDRLPTAADRSQQPADGGADSIDPLPDLVPLPAPSRSLPTAVHVAAISRWRTVSGVVAVRSGNHPQWHGVSSDPAETAIADTVSDAVLTFANSNATAELSNGGQLTLGTETLVEALIDTELPADDRNDQERVSELRLEYGRLAVVGLTQDRRVRIAVGDQTLEVRSAGRRADFMVEHASGTILCAVRRGAVEINDHRASTDSWLQFRSSRPLSVEPNLRAFGWMEGPSPGQEIPRQISEGLNRADDVHAEIRTLLASRNPRVALFAVRTLIDLADARDPHTLPEAWIRSGVASGSEARRVALVHWILSAMQRRPQRTEAIWSAVREHASQRNGQQQRLTNTDLDNLRETYHSAIQRVSPDGNRIRRLVQQLQPNQHVFVRQSAKFFLEQILQEQLTEYDPLNPSRRAITSVVQRLRRWRSVQKR